jgi:hypothetical protein
VRGLTTSIVFAVAVLVTLALPASAEPATVYRDSLGRVTGTATTRGTTTTFSNALGQQTGRAEHKRDGTTIYYDNMGRQIGTAREQVEVYSALLA